MTDDERRARDNAEKLDPVKRWGDPETRWGNPEKDLPKIPRVRMPGEKSGAGGEPGDDYAPEFTTDVDPEVSRLFWASVIFANIGLAGVTVGPMLIYFRGDVMLGLALMLFGVGAFVRVYQTYQKFQNRERPDDEADSAEDETGSNDESEETPAADDAASDADERNR
ncbi:hypothetical protein [Haloferax sp. DFSO52]|uniref:DUF7322 domain-containing protein n=1 Tax=Haloferax sp. DFSO52 TaxID=3388505 RepID=UPI003A86E4FE